MSRFGYLHKCSLEECRSPAAGVAEGCESSSVGAGNQTWVFSESSKCSQLLETSLQPLSFLLVV